MKVILGIDIGGSTTKIVGLRTDGSVVSMLRVKAEDQLTSLYGALGNYLISNGLSLEDVQQIVLTGVGASYVDKDIYGIPTCKVDEFSASCAGALALSGQDSAVVVTMGTGTAFLWADKDGTVRHLAAAVLAEVRWAACAANWWIWNASARSRNWLSRAISQR